MAWQPVILQSSAAISATGSSTPVDIYTATMGWLYVVVASVGGTGTPSMGIWLEAWTGEGTDYVEVATPLQHKTTGTITQVAGVANSRNINGASNITAAGKYWCEFPVLPARRVRLGWVLSGTSPVFTFYSNMDVK